MDLSSVFEVVRRDDPSGRFALPQRGDVASFRFANARAKELLAWSPDVRAEEALRWSLEVQAR